MTTPRKISTTEPELALAFETWEKEDRLDRQGPAKEARFWSAGEVQRMTPEALGAQRARNLLEFLERGRR